VVILFGRGKFNSSILDDASSPAVFGDAAASITNFGSTHALVGNLDEEAQNPRIKFLGERAETVVRVVRTDKEQARHIVATTSSLFRRLYIPSGSVGGTDDTFDNAQLTVLDEAADSLMNSLIS
jgi:hypothetical protein